MLILTYTFRKPQTFPLGNTSTLNARAISTHAFKHRVPTLLIVIIQHRLVNYQRSVCVIRRNEAVHDPVKLAPHTALLSLGAQQPF